VWHLYLVPVMMSEIKSNTIKLNHCYGATKLNDYYDYYYYYYYYYYY
jgi:hypothetical protein